VSGPIGDRGAAAGGDRGQAVPVDATADSIYDLGYRGYQGVRLGRPHAVASLIKQSLRQSWGLGRPGRAKIVPFGLAAIATVPAVVALGISALAKQLGAADMMEQASPIRYETYYPVIGQVVFLFAAAQAPELLGRDQRHRVLALFFSRAIRREDYATAKLLALGAAMLAFLLFPLAVIFVGRALLAADVVGEVIGDAAKVPAIIGEATLTAWLLAALSLAIASFTPRRAYATAAIFAVVVIPAVTVGVLSELTPGQVVGAVSLISPGNVLDGTNAFAFGNSMAGPPGTSVPSLAYVGSALAMIAVSTAVLVARYLRIEP
jgi:ABC-2 type transport system permease protein